ncbi:antibiotic biosynthesis monooxygenase family protein [Pseudomonas sp. NFACC02]|uniref:antibiotic biosynthesis monooxygenase family protein n=1 Tax=Pseudomonas sp. NFACC02 TaxID=1566250 RepID=UPI001587A58E|nr:antibiotic biosynthesis monooxygenase [Pseudomonas sp. NFACC02]
MTEAISIIEVYAVQGSSESLEGPLSSLVDTLRKNPGCVSYSAVRSHSQPNLWIVTGLWESGPTMEEHFSHPALCDVMKLLSWDAVSKIAASGFLKSEG